MKSCLQFPDKCTDYYKNITKPSVFSPLILSHPFFCGIPEGKCNLSTKKLRFDISTFSCFGGPIAGQIPLYLPSFLPSQSGRVCSTCFLLLAGIKSLVSSRVPEFSRNHIWLTSKICLVHLGSLQTHQLQRSGSFPLFTQRYIFQHQHHAPLCRDMSWCS